jgi:hypothetical protein
MLYPTCLFADIVWPALLFEGRYLAWWIILVGLVVEFPFVRLLTGFALKKCILADLAMNAASTVVGLFVIPLLGLPWFFLASRLRALSDRTFDLLTWTATFLVAVGVNSGIELSVLRRGFAQKLGVRAYFWLCIANAFSVGFALWSLFRSPPHP